MSDRTPPRVLVVGAGIAGLLAARDLQADGAEVVVVDKARGVGGRLATRRLGDEGATADHGAQFFTARSEAFAAEVAGWLADGVAEPWFTGVLGAEGIVADDGELRYRGVPAMTGIAKHLASGVDVRLQARVARLVPTGPRWRATFEGAEVEPIDADAVVITAPAPQALDLLLRVYLEPVDLLALEAIEYDPCIALMVATTVPDALSLGPLGARRPSGEPVAWVADNQVKGSSPAPSITVHAGPATSRELWDATDDEVLRGWVPLWASTSTWWPPARCSGGATPRRCEPTPSQRSRCGARRPRWWPVMPSGRAAGSRAPLDRAWPLLACWPSASTCAEAAALGERPPSSLRPSAEPSRFAARKVDAGVHRACRDWCQR